MSYQFRVEEVNTDLKHLTKKYENLRVDNPKLYDGLINSKDTMIQDLRNEIEKLKNTIDELVLIYNDKIEYIREQYKNELFVQHSKYMKKIRQIKNENPINK